MHLLNAAPLTFAMSVIACGGSVADGSGNESMGGSISTLETTGGSQNGGVTFAVGGTTQAYAGATLGTGGVGGSSLTGGMTLISNNGAIYNGGPPSCGWVFQGNYQLNCSYEIPALADDAGPIDTSTISVVY